MSKKLSINGFTNKEWLSLTEILNLELNTLPNIEITLRRLAKKENWKKRETQSNTGGRRGYEYHLSSLPLEARVDFLNRIWELSKEAETSSIKCVASEDTANTRIGNKKANTLFENKAKSKSSSTSQELHKASEEVAIELSKSEHFGIEISKKNLEKARVREAILKRIQSLSIEGFEKAAMETYIESYNKGFESNKEFYEHIPTISLTRIYVWKKAYEAQGLQGLLDTLDTRGRKSKMENQSYIAKVLARLKETPYASNRMLYEAFIHELQGDVLVSYKTFGRFLSKYKKEHAQELELLTNPDGWKNKYKLSLGKSDGDVIRLNQRWEIDSTKADIMLNDNTRCNIVGIIDVYSRRSILHVSRTSSAEAVKGALLKAFSKWGKPEVIASDNGSDFVSKRIKDSLQALGIEQKICPPFSPEKKPFIERFFKTFSHNMLTMLDGYIGHDVATRKKIESKKSFAARLFRNEDKLDLRLPREELQAFCDNWLENYYHKKKHRSLGMTPNEKVTGYIGEVYFFKSIEALSILMSPRSGDGIRSVTKEGIAVEGGKYWHENLTLWIGKKVKVLFDESNWGHAYVFSLQGEFLAHATDINRAGFSRAEVSTSLKRKQNELMSATKQAYKQMIKGATSQNELIKDMLKVRNEDDEYIKAMVEEKTKQAKVKETFELIEAEIASKSNEEVLYATDAQKEQREKEATERYEKAKDLERQLSLGLMIAPKQEEWLKNYQDTSEYSSKRFMDELAAEVETKNNIGGIEIKSSKYE